MPRSAHTAVLLPHNASVLLAGGSSNGVPQASVDLFLPAEFPDPFSFGINTFSATAAMAGARAGATAGPAREGYAWVDGGGAAQSETYRFATIKTDKDDDALGTDGGNHGLWLGARRRSAAAVPGRSGRP